MKKMKAEKSQQIFVFVAILFIAAVACGNKDSLTSTEKSVLESYQKIHEALASDTVKDVSENASAIVKTVKSDPEKKLPASIADKAEPLVKGNDLKTARENFKGLSAALISYLEKQNIKGTGYHESYCPMAEASWLQKKKKMNNPYFGKSMATCGEDKRSF